jgi:hypothetical protein
MAAVVIGVDPAKRSNTIEVINSAETVLLLARFDNTSADYRKMRALVKRWPDRVWAVEGATGVGLNLAQRLVSDGERVLDVPSKLSTRVRAIDTGHGRKNDPTDAHASRWWACARRVCARWRSTTKLSLCGCSPSAAGTWCARGRRRSTGCTRP